MRPGQCVNVVSCDYHHSRTTPSNPAGAQIGDVRAHWSLTGPMSIQMHANRRRYRTQYERETGSESGGRNFLPFAQIPSIWLGSSNFLKRQTVRYSAPYFEDCNYSTLFVRYPPIPPYKEGGRGGRRGESADTERSGDSSRKGPSLKGLRDDPPDTDGVSEDTVSRNPRTTKQSMRLC